MKCTTVQLIISHSIVAFTVLSFSHLSLLQQNLTVNHPGKDNDDFQNSRRPLMVLPLLKELDSGWSNEEFPPVLQKNATGTRSLVICAGLYHGLEFFKAIENGFEVVGFEPDPNHFVKIAEICEKKNSGKCQVMNKDFHDFPLKRQPGMSYLFPFALGEKKDLLPFHSQGSISTLTTQPSMKSKPIYVPVQAVDNIIQEDVYFFMMDVQGFEYSVLQGATRLFQSYNVRQLLLEVDPILQDRQSVTLIQMVEKLQQFGLMCMTARKLPEGCPLWSDTVEKIQKEHWGSDMGQEEMAYSPCFDDLLCINIEKPYLGPTLPLLLPTKSSNQTNSSRDFDPLIMGRIIAKAQFLRGQGIL